MSEADDEIVQAFLEESKENLDQLDCDLVALEARPTDPAILAQVFRTIHTIKGTCGFLGYGRLEALTHSAESLLDALRSGDLLLDAVITNVLLHLVDAVRGVLLLIESTGGEGDDDHGALIAALDATLTPAAPATAAAPAMPAAPVLPIEAPVAEGAEAGDVVRQAAPVVRPADSTETTVRVDVAVLDTLMDLVGELVLARSQIGELTDDDEGPLTLPFRQLRVITSELQEAVMQARLQPVGTVTGKFRRIVRDLAAALDKRIRLEIEGEEVGVDKAVNEALRDPLLHLVRNAVDHGIETPDERIAAGKPAQGTLTIRAFHQGGRVHVELADDGRGIDPTRLVEKATATGLITAAEADALTPREAMDLMFLPGLSTKAQVSTLSGRGVGMDIVRSTLEHVGGSIDVASEPGRGTVFRINVPLTLAIMPALVAWSGGGRYAIPQVDVHEVVCVAPEEAQESVHEVDSARILRRRGRLLPLVDLAALLRVSPVEQTSRLTIVVVETNGRRFGLVVDAVGETTEAVVKPLTPATRSIPVFAGVTILSDGRPSLILDISGLAAGAGIAIGRADDIEVTDEPDSGANNVSSLLLASDPGGGRIAIELRAVRRLEQFASEAVERSGVHDVVQYRGEILPLISVSDVLPRRPDASARAAAGPAGGAAGMLQAVVCESSAGLVGLVVGRIEDVVEMPSAPPQPASRRGVAASLVVGDRVTELLDIEALVADAGLARSA